MKTRDWALCLPATFLLLAVADATAHPLHGSASSFDAGLAHPFLGIDHVLAMVAVGLWAAQIGGRWLWLIPASFVTAMLAGGALGFSGHGAVAVEPFIALSVLIFGLCLAFSTRLHVIGLALVGSFALFHGLAHAAELPRTADAAVYAAGFATATVTLHAVGMVLGIWLRGHPSLLRFTGVPIALAGCLLLAGPFV